MQGGDYGYGLGVRIRQVATDWGLNKGEFGWDGAAASYGLVDPVKRVSLFFATEVMGCNYAYHYIHPLLRDLAYEGLGL